MLQLARAWGASRLLNAWGASRLFDFLSCIVLQLARAWGASRLLDFASCIASRLGREEPMSLSFMAGAIQPRAPEKEGFSFVSWGR